MNQEVLKKVLGAHKNLIIEGDISSGKTCNVLYPMVEDIISKKESLFILDSKEEYSNRYSKELKNMGYNTIIINLRDLNKSEGWNPLQYPYELYKSGSYDKALEYLDKIGKSMFRDDTITDPFWSNTAASLFVGSTLGLFQDGKPEEVNISSVNSIINGVNSKVGSKDCLTAYFNLKEPSNQAYIYASSTVLAPTETKGGILSVIRQKLNLFVSRTSLMNLMGNTTFSFEEMTSKPTAIFFIARDDSNYLNSLAEMFIEQFYSILVDLKVTNKFHFILDNFDIIEKCNELVNILGSCLSRNMKLYISTRSFTDLENKYGNYLTKLCDIITIKNDTIELTIDGFKDTVSKEFEKIKDLQNSAEYPTLNIKSVKVFNVVEFVENKLFNVKDNMPDIKIDQKEPVDVDNLVKQIDEKIAELDREEELKKKRQSSVLEQFKFDE